MTWVCSSSVPSSSHLVWLCITLKRKLLDELQTWEVGKTKGNNTLPIHKRVPKHLIQGSVFDIVITSALLCCESSGDFFLTVKVVKELQKIFFLALHLSPKEDGLDEPVYKQSNEKNPFFSKSLSSVTGNTSDKKLKEPRSNCYTVPMLSIKPVMLEANGVPRSFFAAEEFEYHGALPSGRYIHHCTYFVLFC